MLAKSDEDILRGGAPWFAPGLALDYVARHAIDFWMTTEDLPHPSNRVTVDRSGQIKVSKTYHNLEPHKRLLAKLKALMGPLGCHQTAIPSWSILDQRIPLAVMRISAGPCGSASTHPAPHLTSTAALTTSTTCTSSTRVSSRRARPSTQLSRQWPTHYGSVNACSNDWVRRAPWR
jgi:hypothetical protein